MWQKVIFMQVCILLFFTHLVYAGSNLFHKEKDADIFQQETFHEFRKEATNQVNSKMGCLLTPSKDNLIIDLHKSGFEVMD
jgi:hypothetical protein